MTTDEIIRSYLNRWGCGPITGIRLAYDHPKAKVYDVTLQHRSLYVILGYGPPAHYEKGWIVGMNEYRAVLAQYIGNADLIEAEVASGEKDTTLEVSTVADV